MKPWRKVKYRDESVEADAPGAELTEMESIVQCLLSNVDESLEAVAPGAELISWKND